MARLSDLLRGFASVRAEGAEPARILDLCTTHQIEFWAAAPKNELCLELCIRLSDVPRFLALENEARCELELIQRRGAPLKIRQARGRFVMWLMPFALLLLLTASSMFTWKIELRGNETVADAELLNVLEDCGVHIGCFSPTLSSYTIQNKALSEIPELKWLSVSVFGSRVLVSVRERTDIPEVYDKKEPVKVVAGYPGIIEHMRAFCGKPQFISGQTVAKGDLLISALVPSTADDPMLCHARGEVIARTWHEITAITPLESTVKVKKTEEKRRFTLKLGDSRIKFYSSSGIPGAKCDNIIREYKLGIDGVFTLPLSLICETTISYETLTEEVNLALCKAELQAACEAELLRRIGDGGAVITQSVTFSQSGGLLVASLISECRQDIAVEKPLTSEELAQIQYENKALEENSTQ